MEFSKTETFLLYENMTQICANFNGFLQRGYLNLTLSV